jgi:NADPH-dependent 7-cyano-7-deazaguanine reductase QueF-like protein
MDVVFQVMEIRISKEANNIIEVKQDGLYVKSYDLDIQSIINDVQELQ